MNTIQKSFQRVQQQQNDFQAKGGGQGGSPEKHTSPKKNPFGHKIKVSQEPLHRKHSGQPANVTDEGDPADMEGYGAVPSKIEDVPFRRQDRRVLNAWKKRVTDRKLYKCILISGLLLILAGAALLYVYIAKQAELQWTQPFVIIGPVLICSGLAIMLFAIEVLMRLVKNARRVKDPELDNITNLHHVKHWVDPILVPFGWGQNPEDDPEYDHGRVEVSDRATLKGSLAAVNPLVTSSSTSTMTSSSSEPAPAVMEVTTAAFRSASAAVLLRRQPSQDEIELMEIEGRKTCQSNDISSDIFDESLRYSNVDRPTFTIDKVLDNSQDLRRAQQQLRGEFQTEEDRIKSLFATSASSK